MVTCPFCKREFKSLTNTHLKKEHGITMDDFKKDHPEFELASQETKDKLSEALQGVNVGRPRPDAKLRMDNNNPMKNPESNKKMGETRSARIASGDIPALDNLGHLPTEKEKLVLSIFQKNNIPLTYVGDGQKWIGNKCPDFINEEMKIVVELDLDMMRHEQEKENLRAHYLSHGYLCIHLVSTEESHIVRWLSPFFSGGPRWEKVKRVTKEKTQGKQMVYNYHVEPNNSFFADRLLVHNCYADAFRASLYTSFFDNSREIGFRHCNSTYFKTELDKMMKYRGQRDIVTKNTVQKAFAMEIPLRFGIRFEDFLPTEATDGVSLELLNHLKDIHYPVMINTKSALIGEDKYVEALAGNPGKAAVHITMITADEGVLSKLEAGAPTFAERIQAAKNLTDAGVRVVARIEPFMVHITDSKDKIQEYIEAIRGAGIQHLTWDTYSYSAFSPGIRRNFERAGFDFDRMFSLMSDTQWLGSLLLGKMMDHFRGEGFSCSTFDFGNSSRNDDDICCSVGDWFKGFSYGNTTSAIRYIRSFGGTAVRWPDFVGFVQSNGGFLSESIFDDVHHGWNLMGNQAYTPGWAQGLYPIGFDEVGDRIWTYQESKDFREETLEALL